MASTNKTQNYNLSQFVASDKPAWLTDVNNDMLNIDTAIKAVSDRVGVNEASITGLEADLEDTNTAVTALQVASGNHATDISALQAQDVIIRNDIQTTNGNVTALQQQVNKILPSNADGIYIYTAPSQTISNGQTEYDLSSIFSTIRYAVAEVSNMSSGYIVTATAWSGSTINVRYAQRSNMGAIPTDIPSPTTRILIVGVLA